MRGTLDSTVYHTDNLSRPNNHVNPFTLVKSPPASTHDSLSGCCHSWSLGNNDNSRSILRPYHETNVSPLEMMAMTTPGAIPGQLHESKFDLYFNLSDSFHFKLYQMLREVEECGLAYIVSWQPHGKW